MSDATAAAAEPVVAAPPPEAKLDDVMLAMDVVDTLRHQDVEVARELDEDERDRQLIERLRLIYRGQGIVVTDAILVEGVKALKESRFVYTPPRPGLGRTLALVWVDRKRIGTGALVAVLALGIGFGAYQYFVVGAAEREAAAQRIEFTETLPREVERLSKAIDAEARVEEARRRAAASVAEAEQAMAAKDGSAARKAIADLSALLAQLRQTYTLRIVSRPGEQSGIFRLPPNRTSRNYYLIVEPIGPDGRSVKLPITSEEDQKTVTIDRFGVRVSPETFDRVRRDKADDGIIQRAVLGEKRRGELDIRFTDGMTVSGGFITSGW